MTSRSRFARIRMGALALTVAIALGATAAPLIVPDGSAFAATFVSGDVSGVWNADDDPYILSGNVTVPAGQTLTILPAVAVRAAPGLYIQVFGTLTADGTPTQPVTFTSYSDSAGGSPQPGDWVGLYAQSGSVVTLNNTYMRYGGGSGGANLATSAGSAASVTWSGGFCDLSLTDGIRISSADISLSNLEVTGNGDDGIELTPTNPPYLNLVDCDQNAGAAIRVNQNPGSFPGTLTGSGNDTNGIVIAGSLGGAALNGTWNWGFNFELPYVIEGIVTVGAGDTLEVAHRATVKLANPSAYLHVIGTGARLRTLGFAGQRVVFTSMKDDGIGGDTNGDGGATSPAPGDWQAIYVNNDCSVDLAWTDMRYGGSAGQANLATSAGAVASFVWNGGVTSFSANDGARVTCINFAISNVDANDNAADGFEITPTNPPVFTNFFVANRNGGYAMRVTQNPGSFPGGWLGGNNGVNGVYVTGTLGGAAVAQTWRWGASAALPFVIGQLDCTGPDTLEIAAATVVKFDASSSFLHIIAAGAHLRTLGTSGAPVWFTSRKDDTVGGDTNNDGAASSPAGGDWQALYLNNSCTAELNAAELAFGGAGNLANVMTSAGPAAYVSWNGGGTHNSANDGMRLSCVNSSFANMSANGNAADGLEITPTYPPVFDNISASYNAGYGMRITQSPGSFPANLSGSGNGMSGVYVTGSLGGSAANQKWLWGANPLFPYIVGQLDCTGPDSLEIAAGAVVKFDASSSYLHINAAGAHLSTLGTSANPVWFTSRKDDARGGDTNGDGGGSAPAGGDWQALYINNSCTIDLNGTHLAYGGGAGLANMTTSAGPAAALSWNGGGAHNSANDGIRVACTASSFANLEFSGNAIDGLEVVPTNPPAFDAIAANNNAAYGVRVTQNPGSFPGNITGSGNGVNGIYVTGSLGGPAPNQQWSWGANPSFPYVVGQLDCTGPDSLQIAAGSVVKFDASSSYLHINAAGSHMRTLGTSDAPVWFTSRNDDSQGGDTNNDGSASSAAAGDWQTLYLNNGATAELAETWIAYGGAAGLANVTVSAGPPALAWNGGGCIRSASDGVRGSFTGFALSRVRVAENLGRGVSITPPAGASATNCDFYENDNAASNYGVVNIGTSATINATNSWWGDATGPFDPSPGPPSINAGGLGERVTDYVDYGSWLSAPNTNAPPTGFALVAPANGMEVMPFAVTFTWRPAVDPEGGAVSYDLIIDDSPAFASPLIVATGLADTTHNAGDIVGEPGPLYWRVIARDTGGGARQSAPSASAFTFPAGTGVGAPGDDDAAVPVAFRVGQPAPSPTRGASTIAFELPRDGAVRVDVFDVSGRRVRTLVDDSMRLGPHVAVWDGSTSDGRRAAAGVYFFRVASGGEVATRKAVVAR
ncbi:MAG: FlgD immunoglobulin-like domain containing protein [bacterium]